MFMLHNINYLKIRVQDKSLLTPSINIYMYFKYLISK